MNTKLNNLLDIAAATVELNTTNGSRTNPEGWPRFPNGDIDYAAVARLLRQAQASLSLGGSELEPRDPNPEIVFNPAWVFRLGSRDSLLVLKALGDRLTNEDVGPASELCDRLTLLREAQARGSWEGLQRAADAVRAKGDTP